MSVAVVAVMAVFCGTIRAEDPKPDGGRVKQPGKTGPNVRAEKPFMTGTMIDPGLAALKLEGEAKTKAIDALKAWKTKVDEEQAKLNAQRKELQDKIKAEADKDKKKALQDELAKLPKGPTDAEKYKGARDALKGILTDEQLTKIDETAKATLVESGLKAFDSGIENIAKAIIGLRDEFVRRNYPIDSGLKYIFDELEHPLEMSLAYFGVDATPYIPVFLVNAASTEAAGLATGIAMPVQVDARTARVFVEYVEYKVRELHEAAVAIDEDYAGSEE